jgi:AAA ATPase domain
VQPSPFTPGEITRHVAGRDEQLAEISERLAMVASFGRLAGRIRVDVGPRGVGKTSLLREAQRLAESLGMTTAWVTAGDGPLVAEIAAAIAGAGERWPGAARSTVKRLVETLTVQVGVPGVASVEAVVTGGPKQDRPPSAARPLEAVVRAAAGESGRGLALFIDELQLADHEGLRAVAYAWQHLQASTEPVPAAIFAAGLSHAPDVVTEAASFTERFAFRPMRPLDDTAAAAALTRPATDSGVGWDDDVLAEVVARAQGYPYFVQLYGDAIWRAAGYPDAGGRLRMVDLPGAQRGVDVDMSSFHRVRWNKATPREREVLLAMAAEGGQAVRRAAVAARLGVDTAAIGVARAGLIGKGLIESSGRGLLSFTAPGFADYVRDHGGD